MVLRGSPTCSQTSLQVVFLPWGTSDGGSSVTMIILHLERPLSHSTCPMMWSHSFLSTVIPWTMLRICWQAWEEVQVVLASPLPFVEASHSTESMPPATEVVDLTQEGSSTIGVNIIASNPMDVDQERKKANPAPKPKLQLLTYTRGKSTDASS